MEKVENFSSLRVRPDLHRRAKIVAAKCGKSLVNLTSELIAPGLGRLERELNRLEGESPDRARPID